MTFDFVHLHVHSEYSLLDGAIRTVDLARSVAQWQHKSVALTDHGNLFGSLEFYEACLAQGVKPILGCEVYVAPDGISSRNSKHFNHLILLAKNLQGWHNLVKLVSIANTTGFYYKPRIDHPLLEQYHDGLIASSACLAGEIPEAILLDNLPLAESSADYYQNLFGKGNFFLEVMHNNIPQQIKVNNAILDIANRTGIPIVATSDAHFLNQDDIQWHKVFKRISTRSDKSDDNNDDNSYEQIYGSCYLASPQEMYQYFYDTIPQALSNTVLIADMCNVTLDTHHEQYLLPDISLPDGVTKNDELISRARSGLQAKFSAKGLNVPEQYSNRLEYELDVITKMGFSAYFLIVSSIIQAAKDKHIPIGPGRGSAAGSVAAWALNITELDPLRFNLLFERFLNPERISMPDIDTDVSDKGREQLLKYISDTYGSDHVAQIITFGRMKGRQSIKDVGRALGKDFALMDKIAKLVPEKAKNINAALDEAPELKDLYDSNPDVQLVIDTAKHIEGLARHTSQHAAGVVISPQPITDIVPVKRLASDKDSDTDQVVTQFTMEGVEKLGLVKMDFLGLSTLSIIDEAMHNISINHKTPPDWHAVNDAINDANTFKLLQDADTIGVFQLESDGIRAMLRKLKIDCFEDLIAALAMYRPGPLDTGMVDQYIDCKHGRAIPQYPHPLLEPVLKDTYGVILYQEQVMQAANILAGYSMGEADMLRKAMGKKKVDVMQQQRSKFLDGAQQHEISPETAGKIFDDIEKFAGYGFNKSHSAAYALISYDTAYLKANFPTEFMAAYLSSQMKAKRDVLGHYILEVKHSGIDVLPPDINVSNENFTPDGDVIRFGLGAVARMGHNSVDMIIRERSEHGSFTSLWDFMQRVNMSLMNKTVFENLIKAGAFDTLNPNRAQLLQGVQIYLEAIQKNAKAIKAANAKRQENSQQLLLFPEEEFIPTVQEISMPELPDVPDFDIRDKLNAEKSVTGLYLSGHPYEAYSARIKPFTNCTISDITTEGRKWLGQNTRPCFGGIAAAINVKNTKKGGSMAVMKFEDDEASIDVVIFPDMWQDIKDLVMAGCPYVIEGKIDDKGQCIPDKVIPVDDDDDDIHAQTFSRIVLNLDSHTQFDMKQFLLALNKCKGGSKLLLELHELGNSMLMCLDKYYVDGSKISEAVRGILPDGMYEIFAA